MLKRFIIWDSPSLTKYDKLMSMETINRKSNKEDIL